MSVRCRYAAFVGAMADAGGGGGRGGSDGGVGGGRYSDGHDKNENDEDGNQN